jgi:hypothetical protein
MPNSEMSRRTVLKSAAAGVALGLGGLGGSMLRAAEEFTMVKIVEPFFGAVLNHRHGKQTADALTIRVSGQTVAGSRVTVNGVPCRVDGSQFEGDVPLKAHENELVAVAELHGNRAEDRIRVVWDRYSEPRFRFSIDDNSFFLRDIAQKNYKSLFDCFYLKTLRDLNQKYGVKYTLNIYYTAADDEEFPNTSSFRLPQFPDRYKGEFRDNANWMRLAFHAYANKPDRPYTDAPPAKLLADLDLVTNEIYRFAGEEAYAPPTLIHFGMTRQSALKPLYDRGVRVLSGYFLPSGGGWDINYNWDAVHSEHMSRHNAWKDFDSGIVFSRTSIVVNCVPTNKIAGTLEPLAKDPNLAEIMDLLTHEQYFWPFYYHYIPEHAERLDTTLRWVTERGYKPVFFHEGFLGGRV